MNRIIRYTNRFTVANFIVFFVFSSFGQSSDKESNKPIEPGFYMNYGCTKIDSITCYGYDGFRYIQEITNDILAYDKITYAFGVGSESHSIEGNTTCHIDGRIFRSAVGGHKFISVYLPKSNDNMLHTQYKKSLNESYYILKVMGSLITGYEEKWDDRRKAFVKNPIYKNTLLLSTQIPLKNRVHVKGRFWGMLPIVGNLVRLLRKPMPVPDRSEDCYPCVTEKPKLFEFNPLKY